MNIWQIGFVVRSGVSALVVAFLLGYAAHYQWGFSRVAIRTDALLAALLIGTLVAIEFFWQEFAEAEEVTSPERLLDTGPGRNGKTNPDGVSELNRSVDIQVNGRVPVQKPTETAILR